VILAATFLSQYTHVTADDRQHRMTRTELCNVICNVRLKYIALKSIHQELNK